MYALKVKDYFTTYFDPFPLVHSIYGTIYYYCWPKMIRLHIRYFEKTNKKIVVVGRNKLKINNQG